MAPDGKSNLAQADDDWETTRLELRNDLAMRMKSLRTTNGFTLEYAAQKSGLALSTIQKIESGRTSPSYENLVRIARVYGVGLEQIFASDAEVQQTTRMTVTRAGQGRKVRTKFFEYEALCNALTGKKIVPLVTLVENRAPLSLSDLSAHEGEEFIYVLSGRLELAVEHYQPVILETGDSTYFDSTLKHGLRALNDEETRILWACTYVDVIPDDLTSALDARSKITGAPTR
ncbi:MAG: XRE family transcriptional regulator [Sulfitobacter sp.]